MGSVACSLKKRVLALLIFSLTLSLSTSFIYAEWAVVPVPYVSADWELISVDFISSNEGWAIGNDRANRKGILLHYRDGTWTSVPLPYISTSWYLGGDGGGGLYVISPNEGWTIGFNNMGGDLLLFHYYNGSWAPIIHPYMYENWWFQDVNFTDTNEGWVVGEGYFSEDRKEKGIMLHYLNGSLTQVDPPPNISSTNEGWGIYSVHFTSPSDGWAVGTDLVNEGNYIFPKKGILLHYVDDSWIAITPPYVSENWGLYSVHFTSAVEGWSVGWDYWADKGVLLHYLNGNWIAVYPPSPPYKSGGWSLSKVNFNSPNEGWAVGWNGEVGPKKCEGVLLHYLNGSWIPVTPPKVSSNWGLNSVHFSSPNEGWAVGWDVENKRGVLLKFSEIISTPNTPSGAVNGAIGTAYTYSTGGALLSSDEPVQYLFDWGDGTNSGWLPAGQTNATKLWLSTGTFLVKAEARCSIHPSVESNWSDPLTVTISNVGPDLTGQWTTPLTQTCKNTSKGQKCTIKGTFTIRNIGNRDAPSTYVDYYLSENDNYNEGDILLKSVRTGKIKAGKNKAIKLSYIFPLGQVVTGKYIIAVIDKYNSVIETDETNNIVVYGPIQ